MAIPIFLITITIIVLIVFGTVFFAIFQLIKTVIEDRIKIRSEQEIIKTAGMINHLKKNDVTIIDELLKEIIIPKNMEVIIENEFIIIKYNKLVYNVDKERFIVSC